MSSSNGTVGIVANPLAGKDIRRLVSHATHTSDATKIATVRRIIIGAVEGGARRLMLTDDVNRLCARALDRLELSPTVHVEFVESPGTRSRLDTVAAARSMAAGGVDVVVVLGGDGTCRDVALGWPQAPMIALATGTNNVFPRFVEPTAAGQAAGFVASGAIGLHHVAAPAKYIDVTICSHHSEQPDEPLGDQPGASLNEQSGEPPGDVRREIALVEVGLLASSFTGARAVNNTSALRAVLAVVASPASTGLSAVIGRTSPVSRTDPFGAVALIGHALEPSCSNGRTVRVPLSPGLFEPVDVHSVQRLSFDEPVSFVGPLVVSFDGERDRWVPPGGAVTLIVRSNGPMVIDVDRTLHLAAERHLFDVPKEGPDGH